MLNNITFGQYFPGNSPLHRMDPRMKLILTIVYVVLLFVVNNWLGFVVTAVYLVACILISKIPFKLVLRGVKPIIPLVVFTSILNMFFVDGQVLVKLGFLKLTVDGIVLAIKMTLRIVLLIMGSSLLTYTTSPIALTDGIEHLLRPLEKISFSRP